MLTNDLGRCCAITASRSCSSKPARPRSREGVRVRRPELLKVGVASVVAMSHSVLVETARRFVEVFYQALAGASVWAMPCSPASGSSRTTPSAAASSARANCGSTIGSCPCSSRKRTTRSSSRPRPPSRREDFQSRLAARLGDLPPVPATGFIGRSRELLALQRLLRQGSTTRYAVVRGQGGEGKTALAAEFARWMVRSQQMHRAAFVSVETHGNQRAVVDALGKQVVNQAFSAAGDLDEAIRAIERALEQPTLLVMDNMESILLPPFLEQETPEALSHEAREALHAILALCEHC